MAKVVIIGNARSGKSSMMRKVLGLNDMEEYIPTIGVEMHPVALDDNKSFNIWDCAGNPSLRGLGEGYLIRAKIIIVFEGGVNTPACQGKTVQEWKLWARENGANEAVPILTFSSRESSAKDFIDLLNTIDL